MTGPKKRRSSSCSLGKGGDCIAGGVRRRKPIQRPLPSTTAAKAEVKPTGIRVGATISRRRSVPPTASTTVARSSGKGARDDPEIVEVLDAAVGLPGADHRLELLGDHGLVRAHDDVGPRQAGQQGWEGVPFRRRMDMVAEADVDQHRDDRAGQAGLQAQPRTPVSVGFAGRLDLQRSRIEHDAVDRPLHLADVSEDLTQIGRIGVPSAEEVEVASGPEDVLRLGGEQHGALQHEALGGLGPVQAEQQSFDGVARQDSPKVVAARPGMRAPCSGTTSPRR